MKTFEQCVNKTITGDYDNGDWTESDFAFFTAEESAEEYADQFKPKWIPITLDTLPDIDQPVLLKDSKLKCYQASSLSKNGYFIDSPYEWETGFDMPAQFNSYDFWQPIID